MNNDYETEEKIVGLVKSFKPRELDVDVVSGIKDIREEAAGLINDTNDILRDGFWFKADIVALRSRIEVLSIIIDGLENEAYK